MIEQPEVNYFPLDLQSTLKIMGKINQDVYGVDPFEIDERPKQALPSDNEIDAIVKYQQEHV